jgi:hypothetical protein
VLSGFGEFDEVRERCDVDGGWDAEAISEEVVIGDAEFTAGLEQTEHGVASRLSCLADGAAGDLALGDDGADVVSDPLVWSGISGRSTTRRSSAFCPCMRMRCRSSMA